MGNTGGNLLGYLCSDMEAFIFILLLIILTCKNIESFHKFMWKCIYCLRLLKYGMKTAVIVVRNRCCQKTGALENLYLWKFTLLEYSSTHLLNVLTIIYNSITKLYHVKINVVYSMVLEAILIFLLWTLK